jgi:hypothetical protein
MALLRPQQSSKEIHVTKIIKHKLIRFGSAKRLTKGLDSEGGEAYVNTAFG